MGEGPERCDAGLPVADSVPRRDPRTADRIVELSQRGYSGQTRRRMVLFLQRRTAEPVGALPHRAAGRGGRSVHRPQYALGRRYGGPFGRDLLQGRQILRLLGRRIGFGLGRNPCDEHCRPYADFGPDQLGEVFGSRVGARFQRILLQCVRRSSEGRFLVAEPVSEGLLPPSRYAAVGRQAGLCRRGASVALFQPWPSKDGQWLFIVASEGTSGTEVLYKKVSEPKFRTLLPGFDATMRPSSAGTASSIT